MAFGVPHKTFAEKVAEIAPVVIAPIVADYLEENPPVGGLTIEQIKADADIADALTKKHAVESDNQDLSNLQPKETGKGLSTNDYTDTEETKLAGIEAEAEVNNISDTDAGLLTGGQETTLHSHPSGGGGLTQAQIMRLR